MSSFGRWGFAVSIVTLVFACATGDENPGSYIAGAVETDGSTSGNADSSTPPNLDVDSSTPTKNDAGTQSNTDSGTTPTTDSGGTCSTMIVVNELQSAGATASDEFVELYNPASCAVSLDKFELGYFSSNPGTTTPENYYTGAATDSIPAKGYFVIGGAGFSGKANATLSGGLKDSGGQVGIMDASGNLLDSVGYGTGTTGPYVEKSPAADPPASQSIARMPDGADTNDNATDFKILTTPTPGAAN